MTAPRTVFAERSTAHASRIHLPGRIVPIIIVPDLFCTRLSEPDSGDLVWNPRGKPFGNDPGGFKIDVERIAKMSAELAPDTTNIWPEKSKNDPIVKVRHGRSMMRDVYEHLAQRLIRRDTEATNYGVKNEIYFCGYDWRQDNARSALRLAEMVDEALEDCDARKVILVGHGMGGLVCRYYCRALGGEAKVHQTYLLGSPLLGTPAAFSMLKHGLEGHYVRDIELMFMGKDYGAVVFECAAEVAGAIEALAAATTAGAGAAALFGGLYMKLCMAAGHWFSREETRSLLRLMPSIYQLLPTALYSKLYPRWVVFDPTATGVAPTGYMVPLPTGFEVGLESVALIGDAASSGRELGSAFQAAVHRQLEGPSEGVPSPRASRNAMPFTELVARAVALQTRGGLMLRQINWHAASISEEFKSHGLESIEKEAMILMAAFQGCFAQLKRTFVDARNMKAVCEDPYTGFLDTVAERPIVATNLALAYRFNEALTVHPREEKALSLYDGIMAALRRFSSLFDFREGSFDFAAAFTSNPSQTMATWYRESNAGRADRAAQTAQDETLRTRFDPQAYVPPNCYPIFCNTLPTPQGCLLQPEAFVSLDDANLVRTAYLPSPIMVTGDGLVPNTSAFPEDRFIARRFPGHHTVPAVNPMQLPDSESTADYIRSTLDLNIVEYLQS